MTAPPNDAPRGTSVTGAALVFIGACCYGILATVVRIAYDRGFSPGQVVGAQMAFGCAMLWLLAFARRAVHPIDLRVAFTLVLAGIPTGLTGALYYASVHELRSASLAIILLFQFTWMGVLVEAVLERRLPRRAEIASLVLLLVGTVLATGVLEGSLGALAPLGVALGLASAASYTAVIFVSGRVAPSVDPLYRSALLCTGALLTVFVMYPPHFVVDGSLVAGLFGLSITTALLGSVVPTLFFAIGVPRIGASLASIIGAVELPAAMVAARLVLDEPTSPMMWGGVAAILVGVALPRIAGGER